MFRLIDFLKLYNQKKLNVEEFLKAFDKVSNAKKTLLKRIAQFNYINNLRDL